MLKIRQQNFCHLVSEVSANITKPVGYTNYSAIVTASCKKVILK